jgi:hypothetical protein
MNPKKAAMIAVDAILIRKKEKKNNNISNKCD